MSKSLRTLAGLISTRWREPKTCESCGNEFGCGAKLTGCWCSEIQLTDQTRADLQARFSGCLCRDCLEEFVKRQDTQTFE